MKEKAIYISIFISFVIVVIYILVNIYGFQNYKYTLQKAYQEIQTLNTTDRYIITEKGKKDILSETYSNKDIINLKYEDFIVNDSLVAITTDAIPYLKYMRETNEENAKKDATLEKWELELLPSDKEVRYYKIGNILESEQIFSNVEERPYVENPYGNVGNILATSRTIATYNTSVQKKLTPGEAWILAHGRELSKNLTDYSKARIDKVQSAIWKYKGVSDTQENFGNKSNYVADNIANNLMQEAKWLEEAIEKRNQLDTIIVDNLADKYGTEEAGVVSYNEDTKEFLVGPFSIDYVRDAHKSLNGGLSEMIGEGNIILYSGIVGANIYGLVDGKEQLLTDWEFVYTDVSIENGNVIRNALKVANEYGDSNDNIYPYPNEEFYIKFLNPNNSIEAVTKLEFDVQTLNAEGMVKELKGTYSNINWVVDEKWTSKITRPGFTRNEPIWVSSGYYTTDESGNQVWVDTSHWKDNWVTYPTLYTYTHLAFVEDKKISRKNAATLYQIQNAKIYSKLESVKIKVGNKNSGYKYTDYCIPLTMDIGGTVWIDGTEVLESQGKVNGIKNSGEEVKPGVSVKLYNDSGKLISTAVTDNNGQYLFKYVQIGPKYYVQFEYDWMKYKATKELYTSSGKGSLSDFTNNPEKYLNSSHASENVAERKEFNQKFYEIATDKAIGKDGSKTTDIKYTYQNNMNPYYQTATVQEFNESVVSKECGVLLPLQTKYSILEGGDKFFVIGIGDNGACAITSIDKNEDLKYLYEAGSFMKVQEYLKNINLGLVERTAADFQVKADIVSTTFTLNEDFSDQNMGFGDRRDLDVDVNLRTDEYVNKQYIQNITNEEYNWRHDFTENNYSTEENELQLYVLYEYTIRNNSPLISGYITELSNYYDKEFMYPVDNDNNVKNYYLQDNLYADAAMKFMKYPSYVMRDNEIIKQVEWKSISKFGDGNNTELNKMYTESLNDILIMPNEEITVYVYYKVNRKEINIDTDTEYKYGNYIILDNATNGKKNVSEINSYRALDYVEKNAYQMNLNEVGGSRVDIDSNPGNIDNNSGDLNLFQTYEDDTEGAPLLRVTVNSSNGKEISGYVFEDLRTEKMSNNQWVGNSKLDPDENYINNVLVELIRLEYNPDLDAYEEVKFSNNYEKYVEAFNENIKKNFGMQYENGEVTLIKIKRRTGPQEAPESLLDTEAFIENGQYRFVNLIESGKYKVRFLYGDEEQLNSTDDGIIYNGHDYKSTEFKGFYNQNLELTDLSNLNLIDSAEIKILSTNSDYQLYVNRLQNKLQSTYGDFEIENTVIDQDVEAINTAVNDLINGTKNAKILVLLVDKELFNFTPILEKALLNDITVIVVASDNVDPGKYDVTSFSNKNSVIFYGTLNNTLSVIKVYNRIASDILEKNIFENTYNSSTDFIENKSTINGTIYGRTDVMLQTQIINAETAKILEIEDIMKMEDNEQKKEYLKIIADKFKMSAESYSVSINFDSNMNVIHINLGLQKIPESSLEVTKEVSNIKVTLSNNSEIVNLKNGKNKNVQEFINESYNIYMDKEIMHGSNIEIEYKINISNTGEVDNLNSYLKYYPYDVKRTIYSRLIKENIELSEEELDEILNKTITTNVNNIYDYYDNLIFVEGENNRNDIHTNNLGFNLLENNKAILNRDIYNNLELTQEEYLDQYIIWSQIHDMEDYNILEDNKKELKNYFCINTTSTSNVELYPYESIETRDKQGNSSISLYVNLKKSLAEEDFNFKNALEYNNFVEIIETYSINGRRDKDSSVGNLVPKKTDENDSDTAEVVRILPPFGINQYVQYGIYILILTVISVVIIIVRRKNK